MKSTLLAVAAWIVVIPMSFAENGPAPGTVVPDADIVIPCPAPFEFGWTAPRQAYDVLEQTRDGYQILVVRDDKAGIGFLPVRDEWGHSTADSWIYDIRLSTNTILTKVPAKLSPGSLTLRKGTPYPATAVANDKAGRYDVVFTFKSFATTVTVDRAQLQLPDAMELKTVAAVVADDTIAQTEEATDLPKQRAVEEEKALLERESQEAQTVSRKLEAIAAKETPAAGQALELEAAKKESAELREELTQIQAMHEVLKQELVKAAAAEDELTEAKKAAADLQVQLEDGRKQNDALKQELVKAEDAARKLEAARKEEADKQAQDAARERAAAKKADAVPPVPAPEAPAARPPGNAWAPAKPVVPEPLKPETVIMDIKPAAVAAADPEVVADHAAGQGTAGQAPEPLKPELLKPEPLPAKPIKHMAVGAKVQVSSTHEGLEGEGTGAALVDGDLATRWSSEYAEPQTVTVDLGKVQTLAKLRLHWETASATAYRVSVSTDGEKWDMVHEADLKLQGLPKPRVDDVDMLNTAGSQIRLELLTRVNPKWGFSLYEIEVIAAE